MNTDKLKQVLHKLYAEKCEAFNLTPDGDFLVQVELHNFKEVLDDLYCTDPSNGKSIRFNNRQQEIFSEIKQCHDKWFSKL